MTTMTRTIAAALCAWATLGASVAWAQEESDKVRKARSENELEKTAEDTDKACGTKLAVTIDWASFDADPAWKNNSVSSYCSGPLEALARLCEGAAVRAYAAKSVKTLSCRAVKAKAEWALVAKAGALEWRVPPDAVNADAFAKAELLRKL